MTLELTADDFNVMLADGPLADQDFGNTFVRIEGDQVLVDASFSLEKIWFMSGRYFNGAMDDVRIYNRELSADEIQALAN